MCLGRYQIDCSSLSAAGKVPVFGLPKRHGKVYVAIIANARSDTLIPIIRERIRPDSVVYTDAFRSYDVLDVSEFHHMRINHSKLFADQRNHINGIENFWNRAKRHLRGYNPVLSLSKGASPASTSTCSSRSANGASTTAQSGVCRPP